MKAAIYKCDYCGVERKEANHWFVGIVLVCADPAINRPMLKLYFWPEYADQIGAKHLCGQACVHKFVDEYLSEPSRVEVGQ
jgi:hypothetical protein